jgi:hypothetical protein
VSDKQSDLSMNKFVTFFASILLIATLAFVTWLAHDLDLQKLLLVGMIKGIILVFGIAWIVRRVNRGQD